MCMEYRVLLKPDYARSTQFYQYFCSVVYFPIFCHCSNSISPTCILNSMLNVLVFDFMAKILQFFFPVTYPLCFEGFIKLKYTYTLQMFCHIIDSNHDINSIDPHFFLSRFHCCQQFPLVLSF